MLQIGKYYIQQNNAGQWIIHFKDGDQNHQVIGLDLENWITHYVMKEYSEPIMDCANGFRSAFTLSDEEYLQTKYKDVLQYLEIRDLTEFEKRQNKRTVKLILSWYVAAYNQAFGTWLHADYVYPFVADMVLMDAENVIGMVAEHTFKSLMTENASK